MDILLPNRFVLRTERVEPQCEYETRETPASTWLLFKEWLMDIDEPKRNKDRKLMVEPIAWKSRTDIRDPRRAPARNDNELPKFARFKTLAV
jgi:hypothetical protein